MPPRRLEMDAVLANYLLQPFSPDAPRATMPKIQMFLQGPGGELRKVTSSSPSMAEKIEWSSQLAPISQSMLGIGRVTDTEGRVATQVDHEGFLYRYDEKGPNWALVVQ